MDQYPKLGIVYLAYHPEPFLPRAIEALAKTTYPKDRLVFIVVDNPHPDFGSAEQYLRALLEPLSTKELPEIIILPQTKNLGFAGGNNVGIARALELGCDYIFLHNQDGYLEKNALAEIVAAAESDKSFGALQSVILLHHAPEKINSMGNNLHFLGFGYCDKYKLPLQDQLRDTPEKITEIGYASGAALLIGKDLVKTYGLLDEDLFLYHEDLEFSLRLKLAGLKVGVATTSLFYHEYAFSRNSEKMYLMERNRYAVILMYYRWRTILLTLPAGFLTELGLLVVAAKKGWLKEKIRVYWYWLHPGNWIFWLRKRRHMQEFRMVSDRTLLKTTVGKIVFDDPAVNNFLLNSIGNPVLSLYWRIIKKILFW